MFDKINKLRVSTKIILPIILILIISNVVSHSLIVSNMQTMNKKNSKESLDMLTDSIFISLRDAMNTGNPKVISEVESTNRAKIKGLNNLTVYKSKKTMELYSPKERESKDKNVKEVFKNKKEQVLDYYSGSSHFIKVLRPMIASSVCLACHANQKVGDVIGIISLKFDLSKSDTRIKNFSYILLLISFIAIIITLIIVFLIVKRVTLPLKNLKKDLNLFFDFILKKRDTIEPINVSSKDEIGEMVESINDSISLVSLNLTKDHEAIEETSRICKEVQVGNLDIEINADSNNPSINNLNDIINNLISSLSYNISRVLGILDAYSKDDYSKRINSKGHTKGQMQELFLQIDHLGGTLVKLSSQNLKNGLALQEISDVFSINVDSLAKTSNRHANTLESISKELNEVLAGIGKSSQNTEKMAIYSKDVASSSKDGERLANDTSNSMDEINEKVSAISEAISVIDQISFQTNILSLNAAVEAATAGEAGKGFAVVAAEVRNLATRSAEAAKEIKELVQSASTQTIAGKEISGKMKEGYIKLSKNIANTTELIEQVALSSKVQNSSIKNLSLKIVSISKDTRENAQIADKTNVLASDANKIAKKIVQDARGNTNKEAIAQKTVSQDIKPQDERAKEEVKQEPRDIVINQKNTETKQEFDESGNKILRQIKINKLDENI